MVYKYKELCRFSFFRKEAISSLLEYAKVRVLMDTPHGNINSRSSTSSFDGCEEEIRHST
jgi:hypothetical protein